MEQILTLTIYLSDGRYDTLNIKETDIPIEIAKKFCNKHNLSIKFVHILTNIILLLLNS
jgi:hypothetical protein